MSRPVAQLSLQERYAPEGRCFGCGPANPHGLHVRSFPAGASDAPWELVADWRPQPHHEALEGILNGGIIGTLLDCHSNWAAAWHLMRRDAADSPPSTVTAEFAVRLLRPTPTREPVALRARVVDSGDASATVEAQLEAGGRVTATGRATFVAVRAGHPAYGRW